jgi:hypothetical protein
LRTPNPQTIERYGWIGYSHNRHVVFDGNYYFIFFRHALTGGNYDDIFYAVLDKYGRYLKTERIGFTENLVIYRFDAWSLPGSTEILLGYSHGSYLRARTGTISGNSISWSSPTSSASKTNPRTASVIKSTDGYFWFEEYYPHQSNKGASLAAIFGSACSEFSTSYEVTASYARLPDNYVLLLCSSYAETSIYWYKHKQDLCGTQQTFASKTANYHLLGRLGLTEDGNGNAHAIYEDTSGYIQYKKYTYSSNSWGSAIQIDSDIEACTIGIDADNTIFIFWTRPSPDNNIYCRVSVDGGVNWSSILTAFTESAHPQSVSCEHRSPRSRCLGLVWTTGQNDVRFGMYPPLDLDFLAEKIDFQGLR